VETKRSTGVVNRAAHRGRRGDNFRFRTKRRMDRYVFYLYVFVYVAREHFFRVNDTRSNFPTANCVWLTQYRTRFADMFPSVI